MAKRYLSAFVGPVTLALMSVLMTFGGAMPLADASTGWASPAGGLYDTPIKIPGALLLIVFALAALGGLYLLMRKPSGPSALQKWFQTRRAREE